MSVKDRLGTGSFTRSASIGLGENMDNGQPDETLPSRAEMRMEEEGGAMMPVKLPDSNPKSAYGVKKPALLSCVPATALLVEGQVMMLGARKYGPFNWRDNSVAASVYIDAALRHIMAWNAGQDNDPESGVSHLGHVRACMGILIDAMETGNLIDDRPKDEVITRMIANYTRKD
jgi:hypothetical protein